MLWFLVAFQSFARSMAVGWKDPVFRTLAIGVLIALGVGTLFYSSVEGWRWIDALYFSVVTLATVGFGDFTPQTDAGKLFTIMYIFTGLALIVAFAQRFARYLFRGVYGMSNEAEGRDLERSLELGNRTAADSLSQGALPAREREEAPRAEGPQNEGHR